MRGIVAVGLNEWTPADSSGPCKLLKLNLHDPLREKRFKLAKSIRSAQRTRRRGSRTRDGLESLRKLLLDLDLVPRRFVAVALR